MKYRTECSLNKLNCRYYRLFLSGANLSCIPHWQVTAEMPFLAFEICGPSPWGMGSSGRQSKWTGLHLLSLFSSTFLSLCLAHSVITPHLIPPLETEAFSPHPRNGSWDEFPRLVIFCRSISFPLGCGILHGNIYNIYSIIVATTTMIMVLECLCMPGTFGGLHVCFLEWSYDIGIILMPIF